MKATTVLGAALVLALASVTARADEGAKAKVAFRPHWKAGDVVTHVSEESETTDVKVVTADGKIVSDEVKTTVTSVTYVQKCVEADGGGRMAKKIVHVSEYSSTTGKDKDETLKGRTYEVTGVGKDAKIASMDSGKPESEGAMSWLAKNVGPESHSDEMDDILSPKQEVGAGDVVEVPMKTVAAVLPVPIDPEKSTGKVTIEAVSAESVTSNLEMGLETKGLPNPQSGALMQWAEGGKLSIKGRRTGKPEGAPAPTEASIDAEWAGTTADQGGFKVVFKLTSKESQKTVVGGELPKPREPGVPDAPAPDKPAPDKPAPDKPEPEKPAPDKPEK
jgi:hypothetical protein